MVNKFYIMANAFLMSKYNKRGPKFFNLADGVKSIFQ